MRNGSSTALVSGTTRVIGGPIRPRRTVRPRWEARYARAVVLGDLLSLSLALAIGVSAGFGNSATDVYLAPLIAAGTAPCFVACMIATRAWEPGILGRGSEEFSRLLRSIASTSVLVGLVGLAFQVSATRPWVFGVIPGLGVLAAFSRYVLRQFLYRQRANGRCVHEVLAVGGAEWVNDLVVRTRRAAYHGWRVTGACTPDGTGPNGDGEVAGVPVIGDLDATASTVLGGDYRVVAVAPADGWSARRLHQLAWDLEGQGVELVVHPGLMEVQGPRLHVAPVDGLPLLRLTEPRFTGAPWVLKGIMDKIGAALLLLILAPLLIAIYYAVRSDGGPGFFRQTRVGLGGRQFRMWKFRSMVVDAEQRKARLAATNEAAGPLFKMKSDPRITPVGALLRKYSLDELPQLFNVLTGSMSLVGPRPPLPSEVATYDRDARRKLLVKPGLTGLWQISGRSDLSWEEAVRLDLRYVENWTLALDGLILWKTIRAVISSDGAY
ncbi:MAG TPA: sugar transferase [Pseudonocardia sp.]|nr:sugar transferase [Pseudonocardia sp.]